jgi:DNA-binding transcriptional ArsR family regulator
VSCHTYPGNIIGRAVGTSDGPEDALDFGECADDSILFLEQLRSLPDGNSGQGSRHVERRTCKERRHELTADVEGDAVAFSRAHRIGRLSSRYPDSGARRDFAQADFPGANATAPDADQNRCLCLPLYALTRICYVEYIKGMESVFEIIAEPNRRAILSLLVSSQQSVGEIERQLRMPQPTVSKHLRVLREAGFVESTVDAQRRLYRLRPEPLQELDAWLAQFRQFWSAHVDALERHLDRMDRLEAKKSTEEKAAATKRKTKKS